MKIVLRVFLSFYLELGPHVSIQRRVVFGCLVIAYLTGATVLMAPTLEPIALIVLGGIISVKVAMLITAVGSSRFQCVCQRAAVAQ